MVVSPRQPGSALKPFLYALAFDRGYTPAIDAARRRARVPDRHRPLSPAQLRPALPRAGARARGAGQLVQSAGRRAGQPARRGQPAARCCARPASPRSTASAEYYGLGLALGNGDVTLLELANGYRALANGGVWRPVALARGARRRARRRPAAASRPRAPPRWCSTSWPTRSRGSRGSASETPLDFPFPVAAKTGTSRHFTDNWAVGVTGRVHRRGVGRQLQRAADGRRERRERRGSAAAPRRARDRGTASARVAADRRGRPARCRSRSAGCPACGRPARCPTATEWFARGTAPAAACDWHDADGTRLPAEFAEWEQQNGAQTPVTAPLEPRIVHAAAVSGSLARPDDGGFRILSPQEGDVYHVPAGVERRYATVALRAAGGSAHRPVRWFVDGHPYYRRALGAAAGSPSDQGAGRLRCRRRSRSGGRMSIHHVTAIAGDPQRNLDFYADTLGLRLVKLTVNFDDPGTYHFYFGDELGRPGSILTFFPWPDGERGRQGTGQIGTVSLAVPAGVAGPLARAAASPRDQVRGPDPPFRRAGPRLCRPRWPAARDRRNGPGGPRRAVARRTGAGGARGPRSSRRHHLGGRRARDRRVPDPFHGRARRGRGRQSRAFRVRPRGGRARSWTSGACRVLGRRHRRGHRPPRRLPRRLR